ncbi:DUF4148 domain-containing protein [Caballeronia sp. HLA56]
MNQSINAVLIAIATLTSTGALAQSAEPLTREQVRTELLQLENAGYNPANNCTGDCPGSLRHAEAILTRQQRSARAGYSQLFDGSEQSGR